MEAVADPHENGVARRDFLYIATGAFAAIGAAAALWPVVDQWNPDATTLSTASIEVDLAPIETGQAVTILWRGKPIFIRNRTPEEIAKGKAARLADLKDPIARVLGAPDGLPATDENRTKPGQENWLIMIGICTHLGCLSEGAVARRSEGGVRRLVLRLSRLRLRYGGPHPARAGAAQPRYSAV